MEHTEDFQNSKVIHAYCVFCRTGSEYLAVQSIRQNYVNLEAIAPLKTLHEKCQSQWKERDQILLPGYLFLYTADELPLYLRVKTNHLYRILQYERGIRELAGSDADYANWIYRHQGRIAPSRVLQAGKDIQILDGPSPTARERFSNWINISGASGLNLILMDRSGLFRLGPIT